MGPVWLQWVFTVACLGAGGYYAVTLLGRGGRPGAGSPTLPQVGHRLADLMMALGMAAMYSPVYSGIDGPPWRPVWLVVFGLSAAWFAVSALRAGLTRQGWGAETSMHHLLASLAMLFMLGTAEHHEAAGPTDGASHAGHTGTADHGGTDHSGTDHGGAAAHGGGWPPDSAGTESTVAESTGTGPVATVLAALLAGYFLLHTGRELRGLLTASDGGSGTAATRLAGTCHVVVGLAMAVMAGLMLIA